MKILVPLAAAALLAGCATTTAAPVGDGLVHIGQTAYVDGPSVTPRRVIEDSRCPMNARCVWAGRMILRATVRTGAGARTLDLTLGEPVRVADGQLTLTTANPSLMAGERVKPSDYRFGFTFQGGL